MTTNSQNKTESSININNVNISHSKVREFQSNIEKRNTSSLKVKKIQLSENEDIRNVYFYDQNVGYAIATTNILYKTTNGGNSWEKVNSFLNVAVANIFFVTPAEGFAIALKSVKDNSFGANIESQILKTDDGGRNWKIVYSSESTILQKLVFNSSGMGAAVGRKNIASPELDSINFVLLSNDKGHTWAEVSEKLNQIAVNERRRVEDYLTDVTFSEDKSIVALSLRGNIYNTTDNGNSWKVVANLVNESQQIGIYHLGGLGNGKFAVIGGTKSPDHGTEAIIGILDKNLDWDRYRLNGYYLADVEFLSNDEVIAAGSIISENNSGSAKGLSKGVILYSSDTGKNWSVIHETTLSTEFTSIAKLSAHKMFIAGKRGSGIFIEKSLVNN